MPSISLPAALIGTAAIGGVTSAIGASSAAGAEKTAAQDASNTQLAMFNQTQANEQPYIQAGNTALTGLLKGLGLGSGGTGTGTLNTPYPAWNPANLDQTPGYQFTKQQGQEALLDQQSAIGGVGGNTLKALTQYNSGLADQTYQQQFQNYEQQFQNALTQQQQQYNMLSGVAGLGQASAGNLAANSTQVGTNIGNNIIGAGNASAAGTVGITNAINGTIGGLSSNFLLSQLLNGNGGSIFGGGSTALPFADPTPSSFDPAAPFA